MIQHEIRQFVVENFMFGLDDGGRSVVDSLMVSGVMDSSWLIVLVVVLEDY